MLAFVVLGVIATPAFGDDVHTHKQQVDQKIQQLHLRLASQRESESTLRSQIADTTGQIRSLEAKVGDVSLRLSTLQRDLDLHRQRLHSLAALYAMQTRRLVGLRKEYAFSIRRLNKRLITIYELGEPSTLDFIFGARSIDDVIAQADYVALIGREDRSIATQVATAKVSMRKARTRTITLRATVRGEQRTIAARAAQENAARNTLLGARNSLAATQHQKLVALDQLTSAERSEAEEIDALNAVSNQLAAQIRAAQATHAAGPTATPSSAGLIWPVSGPVTSPYGWRWGRMHEGIDVGANTGTPIEAAAAGTVIYCGWEEGYGNLVVIDNGGNLATAYGHQNSIAVACGQQVTQGQVIGYVGCTGHCTGPHLHFEVRIDGNPVDPLGYL